LTPQRTLLEPLEPRKLLAAFDVLVFSRTLGFRHDSIDEGIAAIRQLGAANDFTVTATEDPAKFTAANLAQYEAVVFLSTTGDVLNASQQTAFEQYIAAGHGFVGVHSAADTEYDWPWYGGLVGAYFNNHPSIQQATINVVDTTHPATAGLPQRWARTDEWYNFRTNPRPDVHVLATLDESTYSGGAMGADHPIAWCHDYAGGRAFYTGLGHTAASFAEPLFRQHLLGGIQYAAGASVSPTISAVYVRGSTWTADFKTYLEGRGLGDDVYGYRVDDRLASDVVPWTNVNEVVLRFTGTPEMIDPQSIVLDGVRSDYSVSTVTSIAPRTFVVRLLRPLGSLPPSGQNGDRVTLNVPGIGPLGRNYTVVINVLQGDVDRSGSVVAQDFSEVRKKFFRSTASPGPAGETQYSAFHDVDGNGSIVGNDFSEVKKRFFNSLPPSPAAEAARVDRPSVTAEVFAPHRWFS
jgi:type 1 glutamine amidotransferase